MEITPTSAMVIRAIKKVSMDKKLLFTIFNPPMILFCDFIHVSPSRMAAVKNGCRFSGRKSSRWNLRPEFRRIRCPAYFEPDPDSVLYLPLTMMSMISEFIYLF